MAGSEGIIMAAADNPFYVKPVNAMEALMSGYQGYDQAQKVGQQRQMQEGRQAAMTALQSGGDLKGPLAQLIGIGDVQGAKAISDYAQNEATAKYQTANLAESSRHNQATEGQAGAQLVELRRQHQAEQDKPMAVPAGSELVNRKGEKVYGDNSSVALDPPTIDAMARQAISGDTSVFTNLGRGVQGAQNVVAVRKRIAEINAGQGETGESQALRNAEYFGAKSGQRTLGTRSANIEMASTEFNQILPIIQQASDAVDRTNYPDLNKIIQSFERRTGDPNVVKLGGGINTLINLYARAISPNGVPTVSDKDHAREILSAAWSKGQFNAAVGMMKQEVDAALASPEKVRDDMRKRFLGGVGVKSAPAAQPEAPAAPDASSPPPGWRRVQ